VENNKIKYAVCLKWISPLRGMVASRTKLAEFIPLVILDQMKKGRNKTKDEPAVKVRIFLPEFTRFAHSLGFKKNGKRYTSLLSSDGEAYLRLLVYAVVRQSIRSEVKAGILREIVIKLSYIELKYWASIFSRYFKEYKNRKALYKPAGAFKRVYALDE